MFSSNFKDAGPQKVRACRIKQKKGRFFGITFNTCFSRFNTDARKKVWRKFWNTHLQFSILIAEVGIFSQQPLGIRKVYSGCQERFAPPPLNTSKFQRYGHGNKGPQSRLCLMRKVLRSEGL